MTFYYNIHMKYTDADIRKALTNEWRYLCLEEPEEDDLTEEEYMESLQGMTREELLEEMMEDDLESYMECYGDRC